MWMEIRCLGSGILAVVDLRSEACCVARKGGEWLVVLSREMDQ